MSSSTRRAMPTNHRAECRGCGKGIAYHGRRDLLQLVSGWRRELEQGYASSSRLADVACGVMQTARSVEAAAAGVCLSCFEQPGPKVLDVRQLELLGGSR